MKKEKTRYKLRQLMYKKYGAKKFAVACIIVAQWISFDTKKKVSPEYIIDLCNATDQDVSKGMTSEQFTALSRLFSLNNKQSKIYN